MPKSLRKRKGEMRRENTASERRSHRKESSLKADASPSTRKAATHKTSGGFKMKTEQKSQRWKQTGFDQDGKIGKMRTCVDIYTCTGCGDKASVPMDTKPTQSCRCAIRN